MKIFTLVYQGGNALVFEEVPTIDTRNESELRLVSQRQQVIISDFHTCETFCRGLRKAGAKVRAAWCSEAGDITNAFWHFSRFYDAPFHKEFAADFVPSLT